MLKVNLTQELLQEILSYDEKTGKMWWKPRGAHLFNEGKVCTAKQICDRWNKLYAGELAGGYLSRQGYYTCSVMGGSYKNHRLIWMLKTGYWPDYVDHIDGDRSNNRWSNLRNVSAKESAQNVSRPKDNTSGTIGVCWYPQTSRWKVQIGGQSLGYFRDFDEAVRVRKNAERERGYHENHGREAKL